MHLIFQNYKELHLLKKENGIVLHFLKDTAVFSLKPFDYGPISASGFKQNQYIANLLFAILHFQFVDFFRLLHTIFDEDISSNDVLKSVYREKYF